MHSTQLDACQGALTMESFTNAGASAASTASAATVAASELTLNG